MTKEECAIVTLYTGVAMLEGDDLEYLYRYAEKLMERPVLTHELVTLEEELKKRAEPDFINLCRWAGAEAVPFVQPEERTNKRTDKRAEMHACDLISREAAIDAISCDIIVTGRQNAEHVAATIETFTDRIKALPSAQPEISCSEIPNSSDTISRQAAIEKFEPWLKVDGYSEGELNMLKAVLYELRFLPSAQPDLDEWCTDCKEYDHERHCCPRWNRVIRDALKDAQPEQRWIPRSERLPEKTDDYLCSYNGCAVVDICEYDTERNEWGFFYDGGWKVVSNVIAWMPLPEPYAERRTDG